MLSRPPTHPKISPVKLLIVSNDASSKSRIGKLILQMHANMQLRFDMVYYQEARHNEPEPRINILPYITDFKPMKNDAPIFKEYTARLPLYHITNQSQSARIMLGALAHSGIVILHNDELADVWRTMLEHELISPERYALEQKLNDKYHSNSGLVSIIARQQGIVVFSEKTATMIRQIIKNMHLKIPVKHLNVPMNELVYTETSPPLGKDKISLKDVDSVDDMIYEDIISRSKILITRKDDMATDTLIAKVEMAKYHEDTKGKYSNYNYDVFVNELAVFIAQVTKG